MVSLTRKSRKFNVFRTRPPGWLQKQGERITSRRSSASFTGCPYVRKRFIFKILLFTYKILNGLAPCYLAELINLRQLTRCLRSNNVHLRLHRPVFRAQTYGRRTFSSCAPALWNSLPLDVRSVPSVDTFKTKLKKFLFNNDS